MSPIPVNPLRRIIAVLKLPKAIALAIEKAELIVSSMTGNAFFATPVPTLASVTAKITLLNDKQIEAKKRTQGAVEARNAALFVLAEQLRDLTEYVQQIADADIANAEEIILSAGLSVKAITLPNIATFSAKNSAISGTVLLRVKGTHKRVSHEWQMSTTAANFTSLPSTLQAKTKVTGLTAGVRVYFRHRVIDKEGPQEWSQTINIVVT